MREIVETAQKGARPSRHSWRSRLSGADVACAKFRSSIGRRGGSHEKLAARHDVEKINVYSGRNTAAEERHQRRDQRVRPPGGGNHFSPGVVGFAAGSFKEIRNPPGERGGGI